jgi:hypothetical protein
MASPGQKVASWGILVAKWGRPVMDPDDTMTLTWSFSDE